MEMERTGPMQVNVLETSGLRELKCGSVISRASIVPARTRIITNWGPSFGRDSICRWRNEPMRATILV